MRSSSLTTRSIREARLGKVPAAAKADEAESRPRGRRQLGEQRAGRGADASRALGIQRRPSRGPGCGRGSPIASAGLLTRIWEVLLAENDLAVNPAVNGAVYVNTAQPGSILVSDNADLEGNRGAPDMLNSDISRTDPRSLDVLQLRHGRGGERV